MRLEGLEPSTEAAAIFKRHVDGELTEAEMGAAIDELHDRKYGPVRLPRDQIVLKNLRDILSML